MRSIFARSEKEWREFGKWELRQKPSAGHDRILEIVGGWTDFFLSRHPRFRRLLDTRGIQKMHRHLSHLS